MGIFSKVWKALTGWLKPKQPKQETGFNLEKKGANQPIPVIYGFQKKVPCIKVFKVSTDERGGADNEYLHFICIFVKVKLSVLVRYILTIFLKAKSLMSDTLCAVLQALILRQPVLN